jgi:hypothetical protein
MRPFTAFLWVFVVVGSVSSCALPGRSITEEEVPLPPAPLIVAEEFGPLVYRIDPDLRSDWDRVLELHERLFAKQGKTVEEDDLHRLYNEADANDDDILDRAEIEEAFRRNKREYERYLTRSN